ncbi:hypothetical protein H7100_01960 [Candidatus Saccharibacteria bacterium]|nr:hypothetical protein [Candidatus Saccharibacteria bacterium]
MKRFKLLVTAFMFVVFFAAPVVVVASPQVTAAASISNPADCEKSFLGIQPWFKGMTVLEDGKCNIASPGQTLTNGTTLDLQGFIWRIALNVIGMALTVVGYIAFFFILYGGFQFLTGGNNPGQIEKARKTLLNAVVGLIISLASIAIVNLIFNVVGPISTTNGVNLPTASPEEVLKNGLNIMYGLVAAIAVIVVIVGGITYATSAGNSSGITKGKNMLLYAVIGLIVIFAAYAITNFVLLRFQ